MQVGSATKLAGVVFLLAIAIGFLLENFWVFLAGTVLLVAWLGGVLMGPLGEPS